MPKLGFYQTSFKVPVTVIAVPGRGQFPTSARAPWTTTATTASAPTPRRRRCRRHRRCRRTPAREVITDRQEAGRQDLDHARVRDPGLGLDPVRVGATEAGTLGHEAEVELAAEVEVEVEHLEAVKPRLNKGSISFNPNMSNLQENA